MNRSLARALLVTFTALSIGPLSSRADPPTTAPAQTQPAPEVRSPQRFDDSIHELQDELLEMSYKRYAMKAKLMALQAQKLASIMREEAGRTPKKWKDLQEALTAANTLTEFADALETTRAAVLRGLNFLSKNQNPDGTFMQGSGAGTTAVPSLAVMAFTATGFEPGRGRFGDELNRSIDYVLASQQGSGLISRDPGGNLAMYEHGISTLMLAKCHSLVDDDRKARISKALTASVALIVKAQLHDDKPKQLPYTGGWRYQPDSPDADISVTGWQILALRAAARSGVSVPRATLEAARDYVIRSAAPGGGFGYQPAQGPNQARTRIGILALEQLRDLDPSLAPGEQPREALSGGDWLRHNPANSPNIEFYYYSVYYCSHALIQLGGKYEAEFSGKELKASLHRGDLRDVLLAQQDKDGSFAGKRGPEEKSGPAYRTALAILALYAPFNPN